MISLFKMTKMNRYIGQGRNKKCMLYLSALSSKPEPLSLCTMAPFVAWMESFQTAAPYSSPYSSSSSFSFSSSFLFSSLFSSMFMSASSSSYSYSLHPCLHLCLHPCQCFRPHPHPHPHPCPCPHCWSHSCPLPCPHHSHPPSSHAVPGCKCHSCGPEWLHSSADSWEKSWAFAYSLVCQGCSSKRIELLGSCGLFRQSLAHCSQGQKRTGQEV